jgi:hypothetical protein
MPQSAVTSCKVYSFIDGISKYAGILSTMPQSAVTSCKVYSFATKKTDPLCHLYTPPWAGLKIPASHRVITLQKTNVPVCLWICTNDNFRVELAISGCFYHHLRCWTLLPLHSSLSCMFNHHSTNRNCSIWCFLTHHSFSHQNFSWHKPPFLCWVTLVLAFNFIILQLICKCDGTWGNLAVCDFQTYFSLFRFLLS